VDPAHRLREQCQISYNTATGEKVKAASLVDDANQYGSGVKDLPALLEVIWEGSVLTGVGVALGDDHGGTRIERPKGESPPDSKVRIWASDWDDHWKRMAEEGEK